MEQYLFVFLGGGSFGEKENKNLEYKLPQTLFRGGIWVEAMLLVKNRNFLLLLNLPLISSLRMKEILIKWKQGWWMVAA